MLWYASKLGTGRLGNTDMGDVFDMVGLIGIMSFAIGSFKSNMSLFGMVMGMLLLMMDMGVSVSDAIGEPGSLSGCLTCFLTGCRIVRRTEVDHCPLYRNRQCLPVDL